MTISSRKQCWWHSSLAHQDYSCYAKDRDIPHWHCGQWLQEKVKEWQQRFGSSLGLQIEELTGDTDINQDISRIDNADVICTTPEKFGMKLPINAVLS